MVSVPTLAQVTTAGNTTTNAITVGGLTISNGSASITKTTSGATLTLTPNASDNAIVINNNGFIKFTSSADSFIRGSSSTFNILDASYVSKVNFHWGGSASWINTGGNLLIGTTTDAGYKLDVNGTARVQGAVVAQLSSPTSDAFYTISSSAIGFYTSNSYTKAQKLNLTNAVGVPSAPNNVLAVSGSITAASLLAQGVYFNNTLVAAANNDVLVGLDINPTFTNGAFTGVSNLTLRVKGSTQYIFTTGDGLIFNRDGAGNYIRPITQPLVLYSPNSSVYQYINNSGVGINTPPSARLHIKGSGTTTSTTSLRVENSSGTVGLIVNDAGNTLLGTTTDAGYKLDVNGTARITSSLRLDTE
ncbi:MAG: hypothetical protein ACOVOV_15490, partial [Dolichospermum sp.]